MKLDAMNWPRQGSTNEAGEALVAVARDWRRTPGPKHLCRVRRRGRPGRPADEDVISRAAISVSLPRPPIRMSLPSPPLAVNTIARRKPVAPTTSSPPRPLMTVRSLAASKLGDGHMGSEARHRDHAVLIGDVTTSSALVPLMTTVSAWPSPTPSPAPDRSIGRWVEVGVGQVVDRNGVRAAPGVEIDLSTLLRFMVTPPTSRMSRSRLPFAETSIFSLALAPLKASFVAAPALDGVAAVAGVRKEVSSPAPSSHVISAYRR